MTQSQLNGEPADPEKLKDGYHDWQTVDEIKRQSSGWIDVDEHDYGQTFEARLGACFGEDPGEYDTTETLTIDSVELEIEKKTFSRLNNGELRYVAHFACGETAGVRTDNDLRTESTKVRFGGSR
ncbi:MULTISPECIES: hypothetical protein [Halorussus]|uniref:hypothetical protein n=1 Tax=Halorussus TaxID=1070314 RepID=UPI00209F3653|nr:hypothetical protein [Halorussus vallis]USZ74038.1 hypothetical protein NGM07_11280 [Halorussus vallis]